MLNILSWNIQYGKGTDGRIDMQRIRDGILETADVDIICFQEVSRNEPSIDGGADQLAQIQEYFPEYESFFGPAYNRSGGMDSRQRQFGNLVLSRIMVKQVVHHALPSPPDPTHRFMLRQASEFQLVYQGNPLRLINTHLEYFSEKQQLSQVERLRALHLQGYNYNRMPGVDLPGTLLEQFIPAKELIICGDFNFTPDSKSYRRMIAPVSNREVELLDAWRVLNPSQVRVPTCGVFDQTQWKEGPHSRDYFFITKNLEPRLEGMKINLSTSASDHQPILLILRE